MELPDWTAAVDDDAHIRRQGRGWLGAIAGLGAPGPATTLQRVIRESFERIRRRTAAEGVDRRPSGILICAILVTVVVAMLLLYARDRRLTDSAVNCGEPEGIGFPDAGFALGRVSPGYS